MNTIGFNLIVGAGEAKYLERCMSTVSKMGFDEITIVTTAKDEDVEKVAEKYADQTFYFEWVNDFSKARNFVLSKTNTDFVMFLDADDEIPMEAVSGYHECLNIVRNSENIFYFVIPDYFVKFDEGDKAIEKIERVCIFKNCPELKWEGEIHEYLTIDPKMKRGVLQGAFINHRPDPKKDSGARNIKIISKVFEKNPTSRIQFYYAKELIVSNEIDKGIELLIDLIDKHESHDEELAYACMMVSMLLLYNNKQRIVKKNVHLSETYVRIGLSFCVKYAELYITLGDIFENRMDQKNAINCFKAAMDCPLTAKLAQDLRYYKFIPVDRLSNLYVSMGDYERGLVYNRMAMDLCPDKRLKDNRKRIIDQLIEY